MHKCKAADAARLILICLLLGAILLLVGCNALAGSEDAVGIADTAINAEGELIVTYTDGTEKNLGRVVGEDGEDGKDGIDGANGKKGEKGDKGDPGADGKDGEDGAGSDIIINSTEESVVAAVSKGIRSAVSIFAGFNKESIYGTVEAYSSAGAGIIYELDRDEGSAFIVTNYHVVYDKDSITATGISDNISVYLYGSELSGKGMSATYVGGSMYYDLAVLYVSECELLKGEFPREAEIADSELVSVGERAIAIGNPDAAGISATCGIVSVTSENIEMTAADESTSVTFRVMRVDTPINPGNSGGGLFNSDGNLIGIVNAKTIDTTIDNIGYAIPSRTVIGAVENIIDNCYNKECTTLQRCLLGVTVTVADSEAVYDADTANVSICQTTTVYSVSEGSLGEAMGLRAGDVIISYKITDGEACPLTRQHQMIDALLGARVGDAVTLTVIRDGVEMSFTGVFENGHVTSY